MENKIRLAIGDQFKDSIAIADIGDASVNYRVARFDRQSLEDCVQCRFRILDDQQSSYAKIDDPIANFGADRPAAAGDHDRFATNKMFKAAIIDFHARPQQQILDIDRRQAQSLVAAAERGHAAGGKAEAARQHEHGFRMQFRLKRARRENQATDADAFRPQANDDRFQICEETAHRHVAQRLVLVGRRW